MVIQMSRLVINSLKSVSVLWLSAFVIMLCPAENKASVFTEPSAYEASEAGPSEASGEEALKGEGTLSQGHESSLWNPSYAEAFRGGLQALQLKGLDEEEIIELVAPLFQQDQKDSGILASVSMAQFILESGYGQSELAQNANNLFGMKADLSGNNWEGSAWDGTSVYTKQTGEFAGRGYITVTADFRLYQDIAQSIADHSSYLLTSKSGDRFRYAGLEGCLDYKVAAQIIKNGGYATSPTYVSDLCAVIERWDLTRFDL